jgi:trans-2,3-dihydro-3-hydroxyanthranilate isomerase
MPKTYRYRVVDVFTERPLEGNPLAVFPDADGMTPELMQKIAKELNLSETAFVMKSTRGDCVKRVKIFTPSREMEFAGHPTIGTAYILLDEEAVPQGAFSLEENVGAVPIRVDADGMIWLSTPPIRSLATFSRDACAELIGVDETDLLDNIVPELLSAGNPNVYIAVRSREVVDRAFVDMQGVRRLRGNLDPVCVFVFTPTPEGAYSRMFAPEHGVVEDPATGSATGPLAFFMRKHGLTKANKFYSEQGTKMGRRSILHVEMRGEEILVGGRVTPLVEAIMKLGGL